ncbi:hypothetical protein ACJX0J_019278, partial [Zea mays]
ASHGFYITAGYLFQNRNKIFNNLFKYLRDFVVFLSPKSNILFLDQCSMVELNIDSIDYFKDQINNIDLMKKETMFLGILVLHTKFTFGYIEGELTIIVTIFENIISKNRSKSNKLGK